MNGFVETVELTVFGIGALIVGMTIGFAVVFALFYLLGGLYRLVMFISECLKKKRCAEETEKPLEELTDEEMRKDPRYLAPYKWCNNQPVPNIDEEHPCIIIRLKGTDYVSAGWLSKANNQYYGDYMMLNPDCENPDENLKKTVCSLINMYIAIRDALTEG